jgi:hypothetical protein
MNVEEKCKLTTNRKSGIEKSMGDVISGLQRYPSAEKENIGRETFSRLKTARFIITFTMDGQ